MENKKQRGAPKKSDSEKYIRLSITVHPAIKDRLHKLSDAKMKSLSAVVAELIMSAK